METIDFVEALTGDKRGMLCDAGKHDWQVSHYINPIGERESLSSLNWRYMREVLYCPRCGRQRTVEVKGFA